MIDGSKKPHLLFPSSSHKEPSDRPDGIAPMSYSCIWIRPDNERIILNGYGAERSPSVMLAHGIAIGIEAILLYDQNASHVECVTKSIGFWNAQEGTLFQQLRKGSTSADGHRVYKAMFSSQAVADVTPRTPSTSYERQLIIEAGDIAGRVAKEAFEDSLKNPQRYSVPGIFVMRDALPNGENE